jgi:hypothetical protein
MLICVRFLLFSPEQSTQRSLEYNQLQTRLNAYVDMPWSFFYVPIESSLGFPYHRTFGI